MHVDENKKAPEGEWDLKPVRPRGTDNAKVVQAILTKSLRGIGVDSDPCRIVTQYWDFEGNLLAENDPCKAD